MTDRKPWYLVMGPADANQPGSQWVRQGAASRGKVVAMPIAWEGWAALACFVLVLIAVPMLIWGVLTSNGLVAVIVTALVAEAIVIVGFVMLIRSRSTRLSPDRSGGTAGPD